MNRDGDRGGGSGGQRSTDGNSGQKDRIETSHSDLHTRSTNGPSFDHLPDELRKEAMNSYVKGIMDKAALASEKEAPEKKKKKNKKKKNKNSVTRRKSVSSARLSDEQRIPVQHHPGDIEDSMETSRMSNTDIIRLTAEKKIEENEQNKK